MTKQEQCIQQEINRLSLAIACARYDFEILYMAKGDVTKQTTLAYEVSSLSFQKKCLELKEFSFLPYDVKLLFVDKPRRN